MRFNFKFAFFMYKYLLSSLYLFLVFSVKGQGFSNRGKDFWVGYGFHEAMIANYTTPNKQDMVLYFTSDVNATIKVEIPAVGWVKTYSITANTVVVSDPMPKTGTQDARLFTEGISNRGIHITSDKPIVAYAHIYNQSVSGATLLFPVNTLGQDYYSLNFTQRSNIDFSSSWSFVIATEDSTAVEITPSASTFTHAAAVPFIVILNKGQIYNLMGTTNGKTGVDLTGTRIRSVSSSSLGCKRIAVFSGSGRVAINCGTSPTSSDNFIQQSFPQIAWGKKYVTVPTEKLRFNYFRIAVSDPSTVVKINGIVATGLINNFYYQVFTNLPQSITADKPVMVAQYITSTDFNNSPTCGNTNNNNGDPEMIYISPVEQTIDKITLNSTGFFNINSHYINVVLKSAAINSFTLDGINKGSSFVTHPIEPDYSYAFFSVLQGRHTLKADSGFNAIAYGYGNYESYGYNAGTNLKDLNQFITLQNQYATVNYPATCQNTPFSLAVTIPYQPSMITWDFGSNLNLSPNTNITKTNPVADSVFIKDGVTLYQYKIPGSYKFTAVGNYPVKIILTSSTGGGCSGQQELVYDVDVAPSPISDFNFTFKGCPTDSVFFMDSSISTGRVITNYFWNFGDNTTDTSKNAAKLYLNTGPYTINHKVINDIGCSASNSKPLTIYPKPIAIFSLPTTVCLNTQVTATDNSTISSGNIVRWYWNFGNGDSITKTNNSPVKAIFNTADTFTVKLQVDNNNGCKSNVATNQIIVSPIPIANFILPKICIADPFANFLDSSYVSGVSNAALGYLWDFGDANSTPGNLNTSTDKNPKHTYTSPGTYKVTLIVTNSAGCTSTKAKNLVISNSPTADFSFLNNDTLCSNIDVKIKNNSTITTGSISRIELIWDTINSPLVIQIDSTPTAGEIYSKLYSPLSIFKTYYIKLKAYSGASCSTIKTLPVTISPTPKVVFDTVKPFCLSDASQLITQGKDTVGVVGTFIYQGQGITADGVFSPSIAGVGKKEILYVYKTIIGCSDSASQMIEVVKDPTVVLPEKVYILEGGTFRFTPIITGDVVVYKWEPPTYIDNTAIREATTRASKDITYRLTVNTLSGCSDYDDVNVIFLQKPVIPSAFSPNGDGINDAWRIQALNSYPNCTVDVYDRYGRQVYRSSGYSIAWDGNNLAVGVYYYVIDLKNNQKPITGNVTIIR